MLESSQQQQSAGLIEKAGSLQGVSQLKKSERQRYYTAFGISAKEADGHEVSLAAAGKDVAEPANKRRRTTTVKVSRAPSCHCTLVCHMTLVHRTGSDGQFERTYSS